MVVDESELDTACDGDGAEGGVTQAVEAHGGLGPGVEGDVKYDLPEICTLHLCKAIG